MSIGVVIVTYRRPDIVVQTLDGVLAQTTPPDCVIVIDNDADPLVEAAIAAKFPAVRYQAAPDNIGYGAALAMGMRTLGDELDPDWYWLLDDDTPPSVDHLAESLAVASDGRNPWAIATRGGRLDYGRIRHGFPDDGRIHDADFVLVDGTLIARRAVRSVGLPREDFFMMCEDLEYTSRIKAAGGRLLVRPCSDSAMHLGSLSTWRAYYQARNHLRIALDRRSPLWLWSWAYRMVALSTNDVVRGRWTSLGLRWRGAFAGVRNQMGRSSDPAVHPGELRPDQ